MPLNANQTIAPLLRIQEEAQAKGEYTHFVAELKLACLLCRDF